MVQQLTPRGIRNNNPGNIDDHPGNKWQGLVENPAEPRFCTFKDATWGIRALATTLITYYDKRTAEDGTPLNTVEKLIGRWAPNNENDTGAYVQAVASAIGVSKDMVIDMHVYCVARPFVEAIIRHENGAGPLKTANTWYSADVIDEGLRRAGIVKVAATVKSVPVTRETAGASVTATIGVAQLADVAPQISDAMDKAEGNITSGQWVRVAFGIAVIVVAVFIAYSQIRKHQKGIV